MQSSSQPHRSKINIRRLLTIALLAALVLSYTLLWLRMISDPVQYTGSDFITFYSVGTIGQRYGLSHAYDFNLQKAVEEEVVGFKVDPSNVLPHNHMPFLNPLLVLLVTATGGNYIPGFIAWNLLMIAVYICAIIVIRITFADKIEKDYLTAVVIFLFLPFFVSLMNGQDTALLILGASGLFYGVLKQKPAMAGLGLALTTVRPHIALLLAVPFLFKERKIFWWFCAGASALVLVSLLTLGRNGLVDFFHILFDTLGRSRETAMVNFIGMAERLLPALDSGWVRLVGWVLYGITLIFLCIFWKRSARIGAGSLGLALIVSLFAAPHLVYHDLSLLLFPLLVVLGMEVERKSLGQKDVALVILGISTVLLLSFISTSFQFFFPYILMLLLGFYLWNPERIHAVFASVFKRRKSLPA
jgi:hypothetical protein